MTLLTLASDRDNIRQVEPFLRSIDGLSVLPQDRYHNMLVAVTEAVNNAIIHGNGADPHKTTTLHVTMTPTQAVFVITDEGSGFDADAIPDPRLPENLLREGGRGVFLIRQLSDDVSFSTTDHGSSVTIIFGLS
ncbi:MAG: ATP-binding protein [Ignavibacteriae bacterium]|nr:MAG: ATP-binding protein [Ignavibacteriota bacterium]